MGCFDGGEEMNGGGLGGMRRWLRCPVGFVGVGCWCERDVGAWSDGRCEGGMVEGLLMRGSFARAGEWSLEIAYAEGWSVVWP